MTWEEAGVFTEEAAQELADANVTPELAAQRTDESVGIGGYADTIGYKYANGDVTLAETLSFIWPDEKEGE